MSGVIETLERLSTGAGVRRRIGAGEMLFATSDPVRSLFVVESGRLRLLRHTVHGAALALHVAHGRAGLCQGSTALLRFSPRKDTGPAGRRRRGTSAARRRE